MTESGDALLYDLRGKHSIDEWRSCYYHQELDAYLVVYVDDFKASSPAANMDEIWKRIETGTKLTKGLLLDPPEEIGRFLGCQHKILRDVEISWQGGPMSNV